MGMMIITFWDLEREVEDPRLLLSSRGTMSIRKSNVSVLVIADAISAR